MSDIEIQRLKTENQKLRKIIKDGTCKTCDERRATKAAAMARYRLRKKNRR